MLYRKTEMSLLCFVKSLFSNLFEKLTFRCSKKCLDEPLAVKLAIRDFVHQVPVVPVVSLVPVVPVDPVVPVQNSDRYHRNNRNHMNPRNHRNHRYHRNHRSHRNQWYHRYHRYLIDSQMHATTFMCHVLFKTKPRKN